MDLVYVDEQLGSVNEMSFTAFCSCTIDHQKLHFLRERVFYSLRELLSSPDAGSNTVSILPTLHGSDLLREYTDDVKLEACRVLLNGLREVGASLSRVGYFDDSLPRNSNPDVQKADVLGLFQLTFGPKYPRKFALVQEMDKQHLRKGLHTFIDCISMYYQMGQENLSISLENFVGHFIAEKSDLGCQSADLAGYLSLKADSNGSVFSGKLSNLRMEFDDLYERDTLIYFNEPEKSISRKR